MNIVRVSANVDLARLTEKTAEAFQAHGFDGIARNGDELTFVFAGTLTPAEEQALDAIITTHKAPTLDEAKTVKVRAIDARTGQLIGFGFEFPPSSGQRFSLAHTSQTNLMGLDQLRSDPMLSYPVKYNTIDDKGAFSIPDAATMHTFFLTAVGTYRYYLDTGTQLKDQVRAATTKAELDLVVDNR